MVGLANTRPNNRIFCVVVDITCFYTVANPSRLKAIAIQGQGTVQTEAAA